MDTSRTPVDTPCAAAVAGTRLPPLRIEITRTLIVAAAIASRDYQDVHHDAELARRKGSPDIFMNILTTNGLVGRYVTDHFGPYAVLRRVAIRLGAPNHPGDTMVLTGTVEEVDGNTVTVRVVGENGIGRHVTGTVTVVLPGTDEGTGTDTITGTGTDTGTDTVTGTGLDSANLPAGRPG
ncbi:acyl dehydratase [Streptomyces sp. NPDC003710]